MLSRVASRLYWFSRYIERTEKTARLLLVRHQLVLDLPMAVQPDWHLLIEALGTRDVFTSTRSRPTENNIVAFVFADRDNPSSIASSLAFARENMRTTREVLPNETWERVNSLYLSVCRRRKKDLPRKARHKVLNDIIHRCQQITGMLMGYMNHDDAYHFARIGRNLERATMTTRIIDVGSAQLMNEEEYMLPYRIALWVSVLRSLGAYQMYRLSMRHNVRPDDVLEFLLHNKVFPRSLAHTLDEIESSIACLPHSNVPARVINKIKRKLKLQDATRLKGPHLHEFIDDMQIELDRIHHIIEATWFSPDLVA